MSGQSKAAETPVPFERVAIIGAGLIGGSFALALQAAFPGISICAFDRPEALPQIESQGCGWRTTAEIASAVADADLVYIALPVGAAIAALPAVAKFCRKDAFITDAASTKAEIAKAAEREFAGGAEFLPGHPVAGREKSGLQHAAADLFRGAKYILIGSEDAAGPRARQFAQMLRGIGAEPVWLDAEMHDWALAVVSQMPQILSIALARVIADETDETGMPLSLSGPALRDLLRLAGSPYSIWRDICLTNRVNIARSLDRLAQAIDFLRSHLADRELEAEFRNANEIYERLKKT